MRLALLTLLLVGCVSSGFLDKAKEKIKGIFGEGTLKEKLKNAFDKLKTALNRTTVLQIKEKFARLRDKIAAKLTLSPEKKAAIAEKLKKWLHLRKDRVQPQGDTIDEINMNKGIGEFLYQGDMALTRPQAKEIVDDIEENDEGNRTKRQAFVDKNYPRTIWQNNTVYYYFDGNASPSVKSVFEKGARAWEKNTCINFVNSFTAGDGIRVFMEDGCWSYVGRVGGVQDLSLGYGCESVGTAAHELGHALGLFHTQSRYDRDRFIAVRVENIKKDWVDQFVKQTPFTNNNYGLPYDYGNIMHYGALSATGNGDPTMVPYDMDYIVTLGSPIISFCIENCAGKPNKCKNGGFPHPRDCRKCVCPSGYGGELCDRKPPECGSEVNATDVPQLLEDTLWSSYSNTPQEDFKFCYYWIHAPRGSQIEVKLKSFTKGFASDGCLYAGVEIKTQSNQNMTGYRFCSDEDAGENGVTLRSSSNLVPIITYNRLRASTTVLQYRIVPSSPSKPSTPAPLKPSSKRPMPLVSSRTCWDMPNCPALTDKKFCTRPTIPASYKLATCAKSCNYCK